MNLRSLSAAQARGSGVLSLLVLLIGLVVAVVAAGNGASRALSKHEIFVAQTASEMIERGDFLVPRYKGELRLEKPPLAYWLSIAFHKLFGDPGSARVTELEARLPSLVGGILLLLVTFQLGTAAFEDRRVGLVAAAILATSWDFFTHTRSARPDMLYAVFCTAQMLGLVIAARRAEQGRSTMPGAVLAWSAMAGALLAKGPQLPLFLLAGVSLALWMRRPRPSLVRILHPFTGIAVVSLALVYFVYLALQSDGAASFWAKQLVQDKPIALWLRPLRFYYPWSVVVGFLPWVIALVLAAVHCWRRRDPNALMLAFGILVSLFILSFAGKLRHHYVLPLIPLCAVLAAWAFVELHDRAREDERFKRLMRWLVFSQAALIGALLLAVGYRTLREGPVSGLPMWPSALPWLIFAALLAVTACALVSKRPTWAFGVLVACLLTLGAGVAVTGIDVSRRWTTMAEFATQVSRRVPGSEPLIFEFRPDSTIGASFVYYGRRRITHRNRLEVWLAANENRQPPHLICMRECDSEGYGREGLVLFEQRSLGREDTMVLFQPGPPRSGSPLPSAENAMPVAVEAP